MGGDYCLTVYLVSCKISLSVLINLFVSLLLSVISRIGVIMILFLKTKTNESYKANHSFFFFYTRNSIMKLDSERDQELGKTCV